MREICLLSAAISARTCRDDVSPLDIDQHMYRDPHEEAVCQSVGVANNVNSGVAKYEALGPFREQNLAG
jgi:hypothetical protein